MSNRFNQSEHNGKLTILEVNNVDLLGKRFNGYDLISSINNSNHTFMQMVNQKFSNNHKVFELYNNRKISLLEQKLSDFQKNVLSVHSQFSINGEALRNNIVFENSNLVHYHLIHNTKIPLPALTYLFAIKPTVITIHDPWNFTGRCVHPYECNKWKTGCEKCDSLDTLFPLKLDNCKYLWKQKEMLAKEWDIDIIVSTGYLNETFVKKSPITKHFKHVHVLPFGVDLDLFKDKNNKYAYRKQLNIPKDDVVIFLRSQKSFKCAEEINQALKILQTDKSVTILTCSEIGNFLGLKDKYNFIELGEVDDDKLVQAFNACDFFLMPTKGETFGLMAVEAMACSRAVIIFNNTTLPQITFAPDCGFLVENLNIQKLAESIKLLIENEDERVKRGKLGRELAEKHYNIKDFNNNIVKIYERAFERQKYKLIHNDKVVDLGYDLNNINVRKLICAIKKQNGELFGKEEVKFDFDIKVIPDVFEDAICESIDYSDKEVIKFINYFNYTLYKHHKDRGCFISNNHKKSNLFTINNRHILKQAIKNKLGRSPKLYFLIKTVYTKLKKNSLK